MKFIKESRKLIIEFEIDNLESEWILAKTRFDETRILLRLFNNIHKKVE